MATESKTPKHVRIAQELKNIILGRELKTHDRLPSFAEMKERYGAAKQTCERVFALLEQDGLIYRQQGKGIFVASSQIKRQTGYIGYIDLWPGTSNRSSYMIELQNGMRNAAISAGKNLILIDSPSDFTGWNDLEGVLVCEMGHLNHRELSARIPIGLPVINILYNDPVFPSVKADDATGIRLLTEHLINLGHRRIGYMGILDHLLILERYQAFRETLLRHGIEPLPNDKVLHPSSPTRRYGEDGYKIMKNYLQQNSSLPAFSSLLAQNDQMAHGAIKALQEAGIKVPQDISIVGFDGVPDIMMSPGNESYWQPLTLTTARVPLYDIACAAMGFLTNALGTMPAVGYPFTLRVELIEGESTGPCPAMPRG